MERFERIFLLHRTLSSARHPVPVRRLTDELECSRSTLYRVIAELRDTLGAPIISTPGRGFHYDRTGPHPHQLPGLWFNASELYSLIAAQQLLAEAQPGLLEPLLAPLRSRIEAILASEHLGSGEVGRRVRILRMAARQGKLSHFGVIAGALLQRRQLELRYHGRGRDTVTQRLVSPQRLVHYRDNWYLDAWCHRSDALRTFALERVEVAIATDRPAQDIPDAELDAELGSAYGIFAGPPIETAVLRFSAERARWVAEEQWHPSQQGRSLPDGCYELRIPYSDPRELIMDILKYGPDVEVLAPEALRRQVAEQLLAAAALYG